MTDLDDALPVPVGRTGSPDIVKRKVHPKSLANLKGGNRKGRPNKASTDVRKAIARIAEAKVGEVEGWLTRVAEKSPEKALDLYLRMIEYHIPRLARTEMTGSDGGALVVRVVRFGSEPVTIDAEVTRTLTLPSTT